MCAYLSKSEDTCSNAMKQAIKVSIENKCSNYEQMKAIARIYSSNRENDAFDKSSNNNMEYCDGSNNDDVTVPTNQTSKKKL